MLKVWSALLGIYFFAVGLVFGADPVEGLWRVSDGKATMRLTIEKGQLIGRITEVSDKTRTHDVNNPDPQQRSRKLIGLPMVWGFSKKGSQWEGGRVYDVSQGKTYRGKIWLEGKDKLVMRGFVGISLLGRSAEWRRVQ